MNSLTVSKAAAKRSFQLAFSANDSDKFSCVNSKAGPQIPYVDMDRLIGAGEQRLKAQANAFLRTMGGKSQELVKVVICVFKSLSLSRRPSTLAHA